mmetsp:Transcript_30983/g.59819  ORF Transcript_30983/g.59819 Transcript_30983/m.59819 type:complete len:456 (-) Transcript_30983:290-1657(-)
METDPDWPKLKKYFTEKIKTLLAENHALRSVMLQELTEPELEPLLIKPVGTREVTVNILRSEYNLDTLPNQLPTSEIVLWLERCKEDAETVMSENKNLRTILLESVSEDDLHSFLAPPFGKGPDVGLMPKTVSNQLLCKFGKATASTPAEANDVVQDFKKLDWQSNILMLGANTDDPPMESAAHCATQKQCPKTCESAESLLSRARANIKGVAALHPVNALEPNSKRFNMGAISTFSDIGVGLNTSQQTAMMEDRVRDLTHELSEVVQENKHRGEMLNELNQYVELLELRMKQMEEEFAEGKLRMVQDHREALGIHEMEKHQLEQRIRENHEVDEAEKKDLVAFMEAEKLELQQRKDKELALEREKITQLTQMVEEVQRDLVEDLDMKEEKIKQLKIQIAMSESSDIVEKLAQFQNTIAMLQEQLANEMIKRKTCETKLKTTEASLNVLAISKEI